MLSQYPLSRSGLLSIMLFPKFFSLSAKRPRNKLPQRSIPLDSSWGDKLPQRSIVSNKLPQRSIPLGGGTNYPRGRLSPRTNHPRGRLFLKPQHHRLVRPESHFPSIPAKRLIIVEYDLIILHILRQLVDCCVFTEVGANEKPLAPVCPAVGDDPSVFVVIFPCFSPQTLFVLLPEPQEFLVETGDKLPQRSIVQDCSKYSWAPRRPRSDRRPAPAEVPRSTWYPISQCTV